MPYIVNNSRGQVIAVVQDGTVDNSATSVNLVGKNVTPYGEFEIENLVRTLENFADDTAPVNPIEGQLWWNTSTDVLSVWQGTEWLSLQAVTVSATEPTVSLNQGDLWFNSVDFSLKIYANTDGGDMGASL